MYKLVAASIICFTSAQSVAAQTAEVKVLAGGGLSKVVAQSGAVFEHRTGHKLVLQFGEPGALKREIEAGTTFDVVILDRAVIDDLIKLGKIAPDSPVEIARVGMGVAVRNGAPKPDIGSVDAFKRAILDAKSLAYAPEDATGAHLAKVFERLGITEQTKANSKPYPTASRVAQAVAAGEAELGFSISNNFLSVGGVELIGLFPSDLQYWVVFTAGVGVPAQQPGAGKALIEELSSQDAAAVIKAQGLEPLRVN